VQITDANSHNPVTNHYDANGRVSSQSDTLGNTTTYDYSVGSQTKMTYPTTSFDSAWHPIVTDTFESHA
jgi:YD repeat-containing protein